MIVHHREISAAPMTQQLMVAITHFAPSPPDSGAWWTASPVEYSVRHREASSSSSFSMCLWRPAGLTSSPPPPTTSPFGSTRGRITLTEQRRLRFPDRTQMSEAAIKAPTARSHGINLVNSSLSFTPFPPSLMAQSGETSLLSPHEVKFRSAI